MELFLFTIKLFKSFHSWFLPFSVVAISSLPFDFKYRWNNVCVGACVQRSSVYILFIQRSKKGGRIKFQQCSEKRYANTSIVTSHKFWIKTILILSPMNSERCTWGQGNQIKNFTSENPFRLISIFICISFVVLVTC